MYEADVEDLWRQWRQTVSRSENTKGVISRGFEYKYGIFLDIFYEFLLMSANLARKLI